MKDNLFDTKFTWLDVVKICLLIVTMFSTWNVVSVMTPASAFKFVRITAAVCVVEGAFLGFEKATSDAKNKRQTKFATIGFFCSLTVIGLFAGLSGLLEFGGEVLLTQPVGSWLGVNWLAHDAVMLGALVVLVAWIIALASLYRLYSLADPDKEAELITNGLQGDVVNEANKALKLALSRVKPVIAAARAVANVKANYANELNQEQMDGLLADVQSVLKAQYVAPSLEVAVNPAVGFVQKESNIPLAHIGESDDPNIG